MNGHCNVCNGELGEFIGYLEESGEVCFDCYRRYALEKEREDEERSHAAGRRSSDLFFEPTSALEH